MNYILEKYNLSNNFGNSAGMKLRVIKPGEVEYTMTVQEMHLSNPSAVHGGAIAGLMDSVLGVAALSLSVENNNLVSTVEFKINYFKPLQLGDKLTAHGEVIFQGKSIMSSEGNIYNANKELVCKGLGTFNVYPAKKNYL